VRRNCTRCGVRYTPEPGDTGICPDCIEIVAYLRRRPVENPLDSLTDLPVFDSAGLVVAEYDETGAMLHWWREEELDYDGE
jgi:hypothetical protein